MGTECLGVQVFVATVESVGIAALAYEIMLSRSYLAQLAGFVEQHSERNILQSRGSSVICLQM